MTGSNEINVNESKKVVPLNTWILISQFKLAYNILRRPDGTFDRDLAEYLDWKVAPTRFLSMESTLSTS
ncbi:Gibberellin receptor gid1b [Sarracenia purpurea var. burkii]